MKNVLMMSALLCLGANAADFSYNNLDVNYAGGEAQLPASAGGDDLDVEGVQIQGRVDISGFLASLSYENGDIESEDGGGGGVDTWALTALVGSHAGLADCLDFYYGVGYSHRNLDAGGSEQSIGQAIINLGLRWAPASWVELNPFVTQAIGVRDDSDLDANNVTTLGLNVFVKPWQVVQPFVGVSYDVASSGDTITEDLLLYKAGLRFNF